MPTKTATKPKTVPLPRDPSDLAIGAEVVIARPENPSPINPPGRRGVVVSTSRYAFHGRQQVPVEHPRLLVWVRVTDRPAYPGQRTAKWSDELDLVTGGDS